ncbi:MAG: hypothetical protein ACYDC6_06245 [Acidobacteriaceae bacterium]
MLTHWGVRDIEVESCGAAALPVILELAVEMAAPQADEQANEEAFSRPGASRGSSAYPQVLRFAWQDDGVWDCGYTDCQSGLATRIFWTHTGPSSYPLGLWFNYC